MFDSSTCFRPTGPSLGASINCVLLVWYVKTACCLVHPYVRWLFQQPPNVRIHQATHNPYVRWLFQQPPNVRMHQATHNPYVRWLFQQPPNVRTHRATHNLHIPNQQHTVYRRPWGWTCRSETRRAVKYIVNNIKP